MHKVTEIAETIQVKEMLYVQMSKFILKDYINGRFEIESNSGYQVIKKKRKDDDDESNEEIEEE